MQYLGKVIALIWPVLFLAALWLIAGLVALYYARSTRRPIFLFSGLAALLMVVERLLSPGRVVIHYLRGQHVSGGTVGKLDLLFGAYKYEWVVEGLAVIVLLVGIILEVRRARQRARRAQAAPSAGAAGMEEPASGGDVLAGAYTQPSAAQPGASHNFGRAGSADTFVDRPTAQTFSAEEPPPVY